MGEAASIPAVYASRNQLRVRGLVCVYLLLLVHAISAGSDSYTRFLDWSANPLVVSVNAVAFIFLLLHAVTWLNLAPRAIVPHVRGRRVPARAVLAGHYAAWLVVTAVVAWVVVL